MKLFITLLASFSLLVSVNAQSFLAGWDFDGVSSLATSHTSNWGTESSTLSYDHAIDQNHILKLHNRKEVNVYPLLTFVAIKNGEHNEVGYSFFIGDVKKFKPLNNSHVKNIYFSIKDFFSV